MKRVAGISLMVVCLALAGAGCNDDSDPVAPPTMATIWPHGDGSVWNYDLDYFEYVVEKSASDEDLPSMEALHARLYEPVRGTLAVRDLASYRVALEGMTTTFPGVEAQNMVVSVAPILPARSGPSSSVVSAEGRLLRTVARVRPDLRERIGKLVGDDGSLDKAGDRLVPPWLIWGGAFAFEDSGYFGYGDIHTGHSWVYLTGDLRAGEEFSLPLLNGLADDIRLDARIWSVAGRRLDGVYYANLVECMYVLDMGAQQQVDEHGNLLGEFRSYIYGVIYYDPETGPVGGREQGVLAPDDSSGESAPNLLAYEYRLVDASLAPAD